MRLIDANRFRRFAHEQLDEFNVYSVDEIFEMIDEQPTVEAKPVVHGKWITHYTPLGKYYECPMCGNTKNCKQNFCSSCGADMRGKKNE